MRHVLMRKVCTAPLIQRLLVLLLVAFLLACGREGHPALSVAAPVSDRKADALLQEYTDAEWHNMTRFDALTEPNVRLHVTDAHFRREEVSDLVKSIRQRPLRRVSGPAAVAIIGWHETYAVGPALAAVVVGEGSAITAYAHGQYAVANTSSAWQVAALPHPDWIFGVASRPDDRSLFEQRLKAVDEELLQRWFFHGDREAYDAIRHQIRGY